MSDLEWLANLEAVAQLEKARDLLENNDTPGTMTARSIDVIFKYAEIDKQAALCFLNVLYHSAYHDQTEIPTLELAHLFDHACQVAAQKTWLP